MDIQLTVKHSPGIAGIQRYSQDLAHGLQSVGHKVTLVEPNTPRLIQTAARFSKIAGIDLEAFFANYPLRMEVTKADFFHFSVQTMATLLYFYQLPAPSIITVHDIIPFIVRDDPTLSIFAHRVDRTFYIYALRALKRADALIAVSEYTKQTLVDYLSLDPQKIFVAYQGVDTSVFKPISIPDNFRVQYRLPDDGTHYVLFVGSDDPRKNLTTLIKAIGQVKRSLPSVKLIKVGRANFNEERKKLVNLIHELGLAEDILFFENIPDNELTLFYNVADLVVMPSRYEGFGYPVIEAMACGIAVITANTTSLPELVGNVDLCFDPLNVEQLAEQITSILRNEDLRHQLSREALQRSTSFTIEGCIKATVAAYEAVIH